MSPADKLLALAFLLSLAIAFYGAARSRRRRREFLAELKERIR